MCAIINSEKHFPVLLEKLNSIISPLYGGTFIDCTFGQGGYSEVLLKNNNTVIALDRDKSTEKKATLFSKKFGKKFKYYNLKFSEINKIGFNQDIKGIIFDLGYSMSQMKDYSRGFSYKSNSKLGMKMGLNDFSAEEVVNNLSAKNLHLIFKYFGDENKSKIIANHIIKLREQKLLNTQDLVSIINKVKIKNYKSHTATKAFQALRIFVNTEISELIYGLINSFKILPIGGIIAVVTFHSLEDKIVKFFFKYYSENKQSSRYMPANKNKKLLFKLIEKKAILPSENEVKLNPPSRSAKLRYGIKINNKNNFKDFIEKFNYLLQIEKLSNHL